MNIFVTEDCENVRVCRVCLIRDVKMYHLQSYPLESNFENVIGVPVIGTLDLPPYVCYECAMMIKKFSLFRERCLTGQAVLYEILENSGKITDKEINKIDRNKSNVSSRITKHFINENTFYAEEGMMLQEVKAEGALSSGDLEVTVDIKQEEPMFDDAGDFDGGHISSDDEPLSTRISVQNLDKNNSATVIEPTVEKTEKEHKKKKEKKKGRKKKDIPIAIEEDTDVKDDVDLQQVLELQDIIDQQEIEETLNDIKVEAEAEPPPKRGRGRPRKVVTESDASTTKKIRRTRNTGGVKVDDLNLEDFVTVMRLTLEEQIEDIEKRKYSSNYKNSAYQCNFCYKGFIDANAWKHHIGKHDTSAGAVECPVCKYRFPTRRALQKHAINHEKKYACNTCSYVSKTTTQAKQHQRWHKGVTYTCELCDEVSTKWTSYLSHVRMKHPSSFVCEACGYSFVSELGLAMHKTMMHKNIKDKDRSAADPAHLCKECDVQFLNEEAFNRHRATSAKHHNGIGNGCRVCGRSFASREDLRVHARAAHARPRPLPGLGRKPPHHKFPVNCEHCSVEIPNAREYWTHFRRAHPDKPYPIQKDYICDICGKSFRGNAFLTYHKRTHTTDRQYSCTACGKSFFNRTNLSMHAKTHSETRPYPCDVCFKAFKCKGALDRHYRSHTGIKPYECEICGKSFAQSNSRKLHVRTVHLRQPAPYLSRARAARRDALLPLN